MDTFSSTGPRALWPLWCPSSGGHSRHQEAAATVTSRSSVLPSTVPMAPALTTGMLALRLWGVGREYSRAWRALSRGSPGRHSDCAAPSRHQRPKHSLGLEISAHGEPRRSNICLHNPLGCSEGRGKMCFLKAECLVFKGGRAQIPNVSLIIKA